MLNEEQKGQPTSESGNSTKPVVIRRPCEHCGSTNTVVLEDSDWDDWTGEPNCTNKLISFTYLYCNDCGDTSGAGV